MKELGPNWHFIEQGSEAWFAFRCAKVTASKLNPILAEGTGRENALADMVQEILSGKPVESFSNFHTQRGTENEPIGRVLYESFIGDEVRTVGFVEHPFIKQYGASPDAFWNEQENRIGVELKNRSAAIHIQVLNGKPIPKKDMDQMISQMDCCEFDAVDYGSYNPDFPGKMSLVVRRIWRTPEIEAMILERQRKIVAFIKEALEQVENLRRKYE